MDLEKSMNMNTPCSMASRVPLASKIRLKMKRFYTIWLGIMKYILRTSFEPLSWVKQ